MVWIKVVNHLADSRLRVQAPYRAPRKATKLSGSKKANPACNLNLCLFSDALDHVTLVCCEVVRQLVHPRSWSAFELIGHLAHPVARASSTPSPCAKGHKPLGPQQVNLDCIHNPWLFPDAPDHVTLVSLKIVRRLVHPQWRAQTQQRSLFARATSVCITVVQYLSLVA